MPAPVVEHCAWSRALAAVPVGCDIGVECRVVGAAVVEYFAERKAEARLFRWGCARLRNGACQPLDERIVCACGRLELGVTRKSLAGAGVDCKNSVIKRER